MPSTQWFPKSRKWFLQCLKLCIIYVLFLQSTPFSSPVSKQRRAEVLPVGYHWLIWSVRPWTWEYTYVYMRYTCTTICIERLLWKLSIAYTLVSPSHYLWTCLFSAIFFQIFPSALLTGKELSHRHVQRHKTCACFSLLWLKLWEIVDKQRFHFCSALSTCNRPLPWERKFKTYR